MVGEEATDKAADGGHVTDRDGDNWAAELAGGRCAAVRHGDPDIAVVNHDDCKSM